MANHTLAVLEGALRAHSLDRTLTSALPSLDRTDPHAVTATDVATLDACLRGGLPRGQLSEIAGPRSSGRTSLLLQLAGAATRRGEIAALVDTLDRLDLVSAVAANVDLDRLLWIRGDPVSSALPARQATEARRHGEDVDSPPCLRVSVARDHGCVDRIVDRALKALNLVLQAGGFGVVALDLADVPMSALARIPYTTWLRVQRTIAGSETTCVLVTPQPLARSAGGLTLSLAGRARWTGAADRSRRLAGVDVAVRVVSPRRRVEGDVRVSASTRESHVHEPRASEA